MEILYKLTLYFCLAGRMINCLPYAKISQTILTKAYIQSNTADREKRSLGTNFGPHSTYPASNGLTCYVCRPGFYKRADCTVNKTTATCEPCPEEEYNGNYNIAMRCETCRSYCVDPYAVIVNQCNSTADITCRCKDGFYNHSKGSGEWICVPFSDCPPGQEVYLQGTATSDTQCLPCKAGTYSTTNSLGDKCLQCSMCTSDETRNHICDATSNTVCGPKEQSQPWKTHVPLIVVAIVIVLGVLAVFLLHRSGHLSMLMGKCCSFNNGHHTEMSFSVTECQNENNNNNEQNDQVCSNLPSSRNAHVDDEDRFSTEPEKMWSPVFRLLSTAINRDEWKNVMRSLFAKYDEIQQVECKIDEICHDYPDDVKERIYQCLLKWLKRAGDEAYLDDIVSALAKDNMTSLAYKLEKDYPMLLLKNSNEKHSFQGGQLNSSC